MENNTNIIAFVLVLVLAGFTNPNYEDHKNRLKQEFYRRITLNRRLRSNDENPDYYQTSSSVNRSAGSVTAEQLIQNRFTVDNYFLFSLSKISVAGRTKTIGIGIFGLIFYLDGIDQILFNGE
jgi:hypothetical protein